MVIIFLFIVLIICSLNDIYRRKIPNLLCLSALLICIWLAYSQMHLLEGLINGSLVFIVSLFLFKFRIFGAGDGKLLTALAVALPTSELPIALFLTAFVGGILAIIYIIKYRLIQKITRGEERGLPYGIAISLGFFVPIWAFYLAN